MIKSIKKRYGWFANVRFDKKRGLYYYTRYGNRIYIRYPRHFLQQKEIRWLCENLFFHHYVPKDGDQVVDFGIGYGEEAVFLKKLSPNVNYLGVEAQPAIYECVSNTFLELGEGFRVSPFVISNGEDVKFVSQFAYESVGVRREGYIEIPTLNWADFIARYNVGTIDLLKMNIEGAEKGLISSIDSFCTIKRLIVACHDFRANHGGDDFYRTKAFVTSKLNELGYQIKTFRYGIDWSDDWIFASKV